MRRPLLLATLILAYPSLIGLADEKKLEADYETGLVQVELKGKLVRKDSRYCVQARNAVFNDEFLVELLRTEDKNRKLNHHIQVLEGQVVIVRGVLRFSPQRRDGPELAIPITSESQVRKVLKK